MNDDVNKILNKPTLDKIKHALQGIDGNISVIYENSMAMQDEVEYARANGQIWGLTFAKGMLEALIRLEERKNK